ncbi:myo-inosose-2 dehydratase [Marinivivus vitaminiproducens]|uniref:myo-inosose-2 dehydratase n=1 Tax=Marinivivus vitaminiproducens TaxID=3035935 RepID=UPI003F9EDB49
MIRIGANPICWSNDDMIELGGHIPLEQCLGEATAIGLEGMELGNKFPRTVDALGPILRAHGLALVSGWYSTFLAARSPEEELAAAQAHLDLLRGLGSTVVIVCECTRTVHGDRTAPLSARPTFGEAEWQAFLPRLTRFAELTAAQGLTLVYHHHMGTVVQTEAEIDRLMQGTGEAVRLLLDTGHATWAGADPVALAARHRDRIGHVHVKDVRPEVAARAAAADWSFLDAVIEGVYTVPGDGKVDYVSVFRALSGYEGWIVIEAEQDPDKADPATYVKMGFDKLNRFIDRAGLKR